MTDPCIHWAFETTRPFEPGMVVGKGKHTQVACGLPPRDPVPDLVRGIRALDRVDCKACLNSLAFRQTRQRLHARVRMDARVTGYEVTITRTVKDYEEARELAEQAAERDWGVEIHETMREKPVIRRYKLWSSSEGGPPSV